MKRDNFYRRDPQAALNGMTGMTLEEIGVYNVVLDLLYSTWRPLEDNRQFIARWCGCAVQKVNPILERLIARGKLQRFEDGGFWFISNDRFDTERMSYKGVGGTRKKARPQGEVGEKSGEVEEKSPGVSNNSPLLGIETEQNQSDTALERKEKKEKREISDEVSGASGALGPEDHDAMGWDAACSVFCRQGGLTEPAARKFFGRLLSANGLLARDMLPALMAAKINATQDPQGYLTRAAATIAKRRSDAKPKRVAFV
ncbi:DUF1376 domain-containing protein [Phenylobacterium sp.]|uniref:DUF1376 domain-containing protein n=1 Tax=Phenylobacterium sp. TaxID=1871053 RepID=UPI002737AFCF|nr:DUF1376 domain-containing protein [Phenylobacterium sp.]MDP3869164.1 DUF1376 domain-containing protein [Phenylobacterium sp.]